MEEDKSQPPTSSVARDYDEADSGGREAYGEEDARCMSPRRSMVEIEQLSNEAKAILEEHAKALQSGLLALLERVEKVKEEHMKLEGENKFLQEYIGSLMATSRITATKGSGRVK